MTIELLRGTLAWSAVLNMGVLLWWFLCISFANDGVYKIHRRFFTIERRQFDAIHYA